jgi:hypothetical protein
LRCIDKNVEQDRRNMHRDNREGFRWTLEKRAANAAIGIALAGVMVAAMAPTAALSTMASIPGVTVQATVTPIRWVGLIPTRMVLFELAIYVDRRVGPFSAIRYECFFIDADGGEIGLASRGASVRDAFTVAENERLVSRTHEEIADRGNTNTRCRATKLEK